jgi:tetratricopeptide (TPR) repeat protein
MRGRARSQGRLRLLAALLLALSAAARADTEEPIDLAKLERQRAARASLYPVRSRISRYLEAATKKVDEDEPQAGRALLEKLDAKRLNPYERALVYRLQAFLAYAASDYASALESFEKVLAEEVLPLRDDNRVRFSIAQLHASLQQWSETIAALDRWFRYVGEPEPFAYYLRAVAHYQLAEHEAALADAEQAVELASEPAESWLQLLVALYIPEEEYQKAYATLKELVARFPKKQYWVQLALVYGALENHPYSLAVQELAYLQGMLDQDQELRRLARSALYHEMPYPAAQFLEKGLAEGKVAPDAEAFELLANAWIAAREYDRSLQPLEKAAELSKKGTLYVRLAQVYMQREDWKSATPALQRARGGICYYNDQHVEQARASFARARQHDATRDAAQRWIRYLDGEAGAG